MKEILTVALPVVISGIFVLVNTLIIKRVEKKDKGKKEMEERVTRVENKTDDIVIAQRAILRDRIRYLAKGHIKVGSISLEDREDLIVMHRAYHDNCGGNGNLDALMADLMKLPFK